LTVTEDGHPHLWLECPADNERLRRHYEAAGFSHIGDNDEPGPHGEPWISSVYERSTRS
jgi:RimJ/RimL family protein N-acetyltransferase